MTKLRVLMLCVSYFTDNSNAHQITSSAAAAAGLPLLIPILKYTNHKPVAVQQHPTRELCVGWGGGGRCGE
jgi:hypothetical protein